MAVYYRTRKQKDYNALMEELELGDNKVVWPSRKKVVEINQYGEKELSDRLHRPMERDRWRVFKGDTIISLTKTGSGIFTIGLISSNDPLFELDLEEDEIIEYRANKKKIRAMRKKKNARRFK